MKTSSQFQFVVNKKQVGKSKCLKASVLYKKIEEFATFSMSRYSGFSGLHPTKYEVEILDNAYLKDEITFKSIVNQIDENVFELVVIILKKDNSIIGKATFGYALKRAS